MKPILYNESYTNIIGVLNNCIECYAEEERNGTFSLTLSYPITDSLHNELIYGRVIQCKPNDEQEEQYFRIYNTERIISGLVHVYALHISFDLAYDYVSNIDIQNQSCEYALNTLFRSSQFSSHYRGYSDIVNAQNYKIQNVNLVDAIAGVKGSIIDTFGTGAEIKRDNTNIYVYNKRGTNTGVKIEYGVNLLNESLQVDISDLTTSIIGTATYTDVDGKEHSITTNRIDSPNINRYPHPYILCKDYSDRFTEEEVTENKLINLINEEYLINHADQPKCSYTIDFVPLSKCSGYEDIEDRIHLCDTVRIIDSRYGIDTEAKVIKYTYNVLTERYETMELGEPRNTLNDVITSNTKGEKGEKGDKGDKGDDGSIGDFPNSLPDTPVLQGKCLGFASIELNWTYEAQVYYTYELYASKTEGFTPTIFDLIHEGQTSSFLYQANPDETWYFKVCAKNTHGARTSFSSELKIETYKIDDMTDYFSNIAIGNAVVNSLTADFMTAGVIKGNWIDAKNLTVTDGNGKRTLDIDSFGNVHLDVSNLSINSENVKNDLNWLASESSRIEQKANNIQSTVSAIQGDYVGQSQLTQTVNNFEYKFQQSCANLLYNSSGRSSKLNPWWTFGYTNGYGSTAEVVNNEWTGYESAFCIRQYTAHSYTDLGIAQAVSVTPNRPHTLIVYVAGHRCGINVGVTTANNGAWVVRGAELGGANGGTNLSNWHKVTLHFTPTESQVHVRITMINSAGGDAYLWMKRAMLVEGTVNNIEWSPNPSESMNNVTNISRDGIIVSHDDGSYSLMNGYGFQWFNANTGNRYHCLMTMGEYQCLSEETKRIWLPAEFRGKPFKVITSVKRVMANYDLYVHKAPLLSFYAHADTVNHAEGWIDIYASVRGWNHNNNMGEYRGQVIGDEPADHELLTPVVAYWVIV